MSCNSRGPVRRVRAFAKLQGRDFCYYLGVKVELGRRLKKGAPSEDPDIQRVDVTTSDKSVSRRHALISYSSAEKEFELRVVGKNGVFVNGLFVSSRDSPVRLRSQSEIILGKPSNMVTMTFLLPMALRVPQGPAPKRNTASQRQKATLMSVIADTILSSPVSSLPLETIAEKINYYNTSLLFEWGLGDTTLLQNAVSHVLCYHDYFTVDPTNHGWANWRLTQQGQARFSKTQTRRLTPDSSRAEEKPAKRQRSTKR